MDPFRRASGRERDVKGILKGLERMGRKSLASAVSGSSYVSGGNPPDDPGRILVIRTDSRLGNLVLLEPLLRSLRQKFPRADLEILTSHTFSSLLSCQGYEVRGVDKKGQIRDPLRFLDLIKYLRSREYEVAIDAAHPHSFSLSGAVTTLLSGAGCTISTDAGDSPGWYCHTVPEPPMNWHESRSLHSLGSLWPGWPEWSPPALTSPSAGSRDAVGLHVGASGDKRYPVEKLCRMVDEISRRVLMEVYWGSADERETALELGRRYPVAVMPKMGVEDLLRSLSGLRLFITADNGPMHVASALSVPVLALFRVDNRDRFSPLSDGSVALYHPDGPPPELVASEALASLGCY